MSVVTVFRSRLRDGVGAAYAEVAEEMTRLARQMEGYLDDRFYVSEDGERVTIVWFTDARSQRAWAQHPEHLAAQRRGREEFYSFYAITVAEETYSRRFEAPQA